ncbi:MAG: hypothetical protein ACLGG3_03945, partial [Alphaproteobacteria bacterium]
ATLLLGVTAATAQTSDYKPVPPGDGITRLGNDPDGQACTPPGYNVGLAVYPECIAMGGPIEGADDYPPCSDRQTDRCIQTYTKWTKRR